MLERLAKWYLSRRGYYVVSLGASVLAASGQWIKPSGTAVITAKGGIYDRMEVTIQDTRHAGSQ